MFIAFSPALSESTSIRTQSERCRGFYLSIMRKIISIICVVLAAGCSPRVLPTTTVKDSVRVEVRERIIHDTATVEIPVEVERVVTRDTASSLENTYARSTAVVSGGFLWHTLETIPQTIKAPVPVKVTDTLWRESKAAEREKIVEVEKPLAWGQKARLRAFWWLLAAVAALGGWTFRKPLLRLLLKIKI